MNEQTRTGRSGPSERSRSERVRASARGWLAPSARAALLGLTLAASPAALAYVGPGAGLGILGVVVAVLAAVVMGVFGLVMWPIRKLAQQRKTHAHESASDRPASGGARRERIVPKRQGSGSR